jgi:Holliday junction DNA helicase RuvA
MMFLPGIRIVYAQGRTLCNGGCGIIVVMIATLKGTIAEKLAELVILDVQGVGYGVYVTTEDYGQLKTGATARLYIYEHIRENTHDLFGFIESSTQALFELLLGVNGVGPKMALSLLSIGTADEVRRAVASGDIKYLQAANGVGKRVAERVVVDLKDKVGLLSTASGALFTSETSAQQDEAVQALISLGYSLPDAVRALSGVKDDLSTEDKVKHVLKGSK